MQSIQGINYEDDPPYRAYIENRRKIIIVRNKIQNYQHSKTAENWNAVVGAAIELFGEELLRTKFANEQKEELRIQWIVNQAYYLEIYNNMSWQAERQRRYNLLQYTQYLHIQ